MFTEITPLFFIQKIRPLLEDLKNIITKSTDNEKETDSAFVNEIHKSLTHLLQDAPSLSFSKIGEILQQVTKVGQSVMSLHLLYVPDKNNLDLGELILSNLNLLQINIDWLEKTVDIRKNNIPDYRNNIIDFLVIILQKSLLKNPNLKKILYLENNKSKNNLLNIAIAEGKADTVQSIIKIAEKEQTLLESLLTSKNKDGENPLHIASKQDDPKALNLLYKMLYKTAHSLQPDDILKAKIIDGSTIMNIAVCEQKQEIVKTIINNSQNNKKNNKKLLGFFLREPDKFQYNSIHSAASRKNSEILELLLQTAQQMFDNKFINYLLTSENKDGENPLHIASKQDDPKALNLLYKMLYKTADSLQLDNILKAKTTDESTIMNIAVCKQKQKIVKTIINNSQNNKKLLGFFLSEPDKFKYNSIHSAASRKNSEILELLLQTAQQIDNEFINYLLTSKNKDGENPLHIASKQDDPKALNLLYQKAHSLQLDILKAKTTDGSTIMNIAVCKQKQEIVKTIINNSQNNKQLLKFFLSEPDKFQYNSIHSAASRKNSKILELLLKTAQQIDDELINDLLASKNKNGENPLHVASKQDDPKALNLLYKKAHSLQLDDILKAKTTDESTIMNIAVWKQKQEIVKTIINNSQNNKQLLKFFLSEPDKFQYNSIHSAASRKNSKILELLLKTAQQIDDELINYLLASKNKNGENPLHVASKQDDPKALNLLYKTADSLQLDNILKAKTTDESTIMNIAVCKQKQEIVETIINNSQNNKQLLEFFLTEADGHGLLYHAIINTYNTQVFNLLLQASQHISNDFVIGFLTTKNAHNKNIFHIIAYQTKISLLTLLLGYTKMPPKVYESMKQTFQNHIDTMLERIIQKDDTTAMSFFIEHYNIDFTSICNNILFNEAWKIYYNLRNHNSDLLQITPNVISIFENVFLATPNLQTHFLIAYDIYICMNDMQRDCYKTVMHPIITTHAIRVEEIFKSQVLNKNVLSLVVSYIYPVSDIVNKLLIHASMDSSPIIYNRLSDIQKNIAETKKDKVQDLELEYSEFIDHSYQTNVPYEGITEVSQQFLLLNMRTHKYVCEYLSNHYGIDKKACIDTQPWCHAGTIILNYAITRDFIQSAKLAQFYSYAFISKSISNYIHPQLMILPLCGSALYSSNMKLSCLSYIAHQTFKQKVEWQDDGIDTYVAPLIAFGIGLYALHGKLQISSLTYKGATQKLVSALLIYDVASVLYQFAKAKYCQYYAIEDNIQKVEASYSCDQLYCQVKQKNFNDLLIVNITKLMINNKSPFFNDTALKNDILFQPDNNFCLHICDSDVCENKEIFSTMLNIPVQYIGNVYCNQQLLSDQYYYDNI